MEVINMIGFNLTLEILFTDRQIGYVIFIKP